MRRVLILSLTAVALGVSACSTTPTANLSEDMVEAGQPLPTEGYDWFLTTDGRDAKLAYGTETSDDMKLGLECIRGTSRLELTVTAEDGAVAEIHLESGGDTERYPAQSEPAVVHDGIILTAQARTDAPVFQRFRRASWLAVWHGQDRQAYVPQPASTERIERFFAFCNPA